VFQGEVNWWRVESNMTSVELMLPLGAVATNYVFGIALQTVDRYSSGITWHPCTYDLASSLYFSFALLLLLLKRIKGCL